MEENVFQAKRAQTWEIIIGYLVIATKISTIQMPTRLNRHIKYFVAHSWEGFPWEVLEVYSSPPFVCFSWRHWAYFNGIYKEKAASNNDLINVYGFATVSLDENSKICDLKIFFKPDEFLKVLENIN
jgi:hypothetical protein